MNLKPRSDSLIDSLPPDKRKLIDQWLFKDNIGYRNVVVEAKKIGLTIPYNTFVRYYKRRASQQFFEYIADSAEQANELVKRVKNPKFWEGFNLLVGQLAFEEAMRANSPPGSSAAPGSEKKSGRAPRRKVDIYETLIRAATLFFNSQKIDLSKQGLELKKKEDQTRNQPSVPGKRQGGISEETLREIEEGANLL